MPLNEGALCDVEVTQPFISAHFFDEVDGVCVDVCEEECHGTPHLEGSCENVVRMEAQFLLHVSAGGSEILHEGRDSDFEIVAGQLDFI